MRKLALLGGTFALLVGAVQIADARAFRVNLIPNGTLIDGIGCANCHVSPFGGGPRTSFGSAVRALVSPGSTAEFWDAVLAAEDSDGDGFTNGEELQDPDGVWRPGDPNPGDPEAISLPGDDTSVPPVTPVAEWMLY